MEDIRWRQRFAHYLRALSLCCLQYQGHVLVALKKGLEAEAQS